MPQFWKQPYLIALELQCQAKCHSNAIKENRLLNCNALALIAFRTCLLWHWQIYNCNSQMKSSSWPLTNVWRQLNRHSSVPSSRCQPDENVKIEKEEEKKLLAWIAQNEKFVGSFRNETKNRLDSRINVEASSWECNYTLK